MTESRDPIDQLLGLPPSEFIAARNKLAAELKKSDGAQAAAIKALPKPSPSVWATNRVARTAPKIIAAFLDASDALERAQTGRGESDDRRAYQVTLIAQREALDAAVNAARVALTEAGLPANRTVLERVTNDLRWAVLVPESRKLLEEGRLIHDLEPPDFSALVERIPIVSRRPPAPRAEAPTLKSVPRSADAVVAPAGRGHPAQKRADALRARQASARENTSAARDQVERTKGALDEAEEALASLRGELALAEKKAAAAARAHRVAEDTLVERTAHLEQVAAELARAEKDLAGS